MPSHIQDSCPMKRKKVCSNITHYIFVFCKYIETWFHCLLLQEYLNFMQDCTLQEIVCVMLLSHKDSLTHRVTILNMISKLVSNNFIFYQKPQGSLQSLKLGKKTKRRKKSLVWCFTQQNNCDTSSMLPSSLFVIFCQVTVSLHR